jgi:hypothetical protein
MAKSKKTTKPRKPAQPRKAKDQTAYFNDAMAALQNLEPQYRLRIAQEIVRMNEGAGAHVLVTTHRSGIGVVFESNVNWQSTFGMLQLGAELAKTHIMEPRPEPKAPEGGHS